MERIMQRNKFFFIFFFWSSLFVILSNQVSLKETSYLEILRVSLEALLPKI